MKKFLKAAALVAGGAVVGMGLDNTLETTRHTIRSAKIPAEFDGYKIVQISDVHSDEISGLIDAIRAERPDIIVSTGDLAHHTGGYEKPLSLIDTLLDLAPVYFVSGNHEAWRADCSKMNRALVDLGAKPLGNTSVTLEKDGAQIGLSGIDDPFSVVSQKIRDYLDKAMDALNPINGYNILLFHRANWLDYFADSGFDLIISGHMHGGQMRVPYLGGVVSPRSSWASGKSILFPRYDGGRYNCGATELIVSRGLGNPMIIPRVFNRPELVSITLKHSEEK